MAEKFFNMLQCALKLIAEDRLKKDIDDTLLEKLLTLIQTTRLQQSDTCEEVKIIINMYDGDSSDFIKEIIKRTEALYFIEKTLASVAHDDKDKNNSIVIKAFFIRFLGLIFEKTDNTLCYESLLPLLKHPNGTVISDHNPSIQDALLFCLSCISRKFDGALWFVHQKDKVNDVVKCLIVKEDIKLAMDLASSFARKAWSKESYPNEASKFFLLPVYIMLNEPLVNCESIFAYNADDVFCIISKKMEEKSACKLLFSSSLSSLIKILPQLDLNFQRHIGHKLLKIAKCSHPCHKWFYSVLEDRQVHHSLIDFYSSLLSDDVYQSLLFEKNDLVFQNILEYLKKPITDSNFLSQLLLLMKNVLKLHKKYEFDLEKNEKSDLIHILCKALLDKRESVVDSAIHLSGEMIKNAAWQDQISQQGIHSIIWDIAIQGNLDGSTRSTALKVIIEGCEEEWCLDEMKSLKILTEVDIAKKLFDLTYDPDFFLQRTALSCLFVWTRSKWNKLPSSCLEYLYVGLVSAIKSLDLELKLISLDVWKWLLENKCIYSVISPSVNIKDYINYLAASGFGLSMILAFEDYDKAVQYKAASILHELKNILIYHGSTFDSLQLDSVTEDESKKCISCENVIEPISKEEKDKGIDNVMELSTSEQIANICHPICNISEFKKDCFSKERTCSVSSFWTCLWSENVIEILELSKDASTDAINAESILRDIISARVMEQDLIEDIPDCY